MAPGASPRRLHLAAAVALPLLLLPEKSAAFHRRLRASPTLEPAKQLLVKRSEAKRLRCAGVSAAQVGESAESSREDSQDIYFDGYSRMGCEVDISPDSARISFKEHACGDVASCRLTTLPMEPRLCFDFCRTQATAKFFGIRHGRECYCATFFEPQSTGGQGVCDSHCEGDPKEMCGGSEKSSLFEMHMCGDSADEATMALSMATDAEVAAIASAQQANLTLQALHDLAGAWPQLGVCSIAPEGQRACEASKAWIDAAAELAQVSADASHAASVSGMKAAEIFRLKETADADGEDVNSSLMSSLELATEASRDLSAAAKGKSAGANLTISRVAGPIGGRILEAFETVFEPLGDVKADWHGLCALKPIPGQASFAALGDDLPAACADRCLSLSTGTEACVAFNYQYMDGLVACQLMQEEGLVEPSIAKSVPLFEVSKTKMTAMGLQSMGCYAKTGFMAGHPKGPLGTTVVREVTA